MSTEFELLPEPLPASERELWRGRPDWRTLARRGFHLHKLAWYFAALLAWYVVTAFGVSTPGNAALASLQMGCVAMIPLVLVWAYALASARTTLYIITDRRVVMRVGLAMPITFNLPLGRIEAAQWKAWPDGSGDISLRLLPVERLAYLVLWPHVRPWRLARAEPMLRCVADAGRVAQLLSRALASDAEMAVSAAPENPAVKSGARPHAPALA